MTSGEKSHSRDLSAGIQMLLEPWTPAKNMRGDDVGQQLKPKVFESKHRSS